MKEENIYLIHCLLLKLLSETDDLKNKTLALWSCFKLLPMSYLVRRYQSMTKLFVRYIFAFCFPLLKEGNKTKKYLLQHLPDSEFIEAWN